MKNKVAIKKYIAEVLGTFLLSFLVGVSIISFLPTPFVAGLALMLGIYALGHISGGHFNPAVTLGLLSVKKISVEDSLYYIVAQIVGAFLAIILIKNFFPTFTAALPNITSMDVFIKVFIAEIIGTFFFTFGIATVVYKKEHTALNGFIIGGSLLLGIVVASMLGSLGILNPAVALLVLGSSIHVIYLIAPIVGSIAAFSLYSYLVSNKE